VLYCFVPILSARTRLGGPSDATDSKSPFSGPRSAEKESTSFVVSWSTHHYWCCSSSSTALSVLPERFLRKCFFLSLGFLLKYFCLFLVLCDKNMVKCNLVVCVTFLSLPSSVFIVERYCAPIFVLLKKRAHDSFLVNIITVSVSPPFSKHVGIVYYIYHSISPFFFFFTDLVHFHSHVFMFRYSFYFHCG
jgi:hypothetical protein